MAIQLQEQPEADDCADLVLLYLPDGPYAVAQDVLDGWTSGLWMPPEQTPCQQPNVDPGVFDPSDGDELQEALNICADCPIAIRRRCAIQGEYGGEFGVWGGGYYRWGWLIAMPRFRRHLY